MRGEHKKRLVKTIISFQINNVIKNTIKMLFPLTNGNYITLPTILMKANICTKKQSIKSPDDDTLLFCFISLWAI